MKPVYLFTFLLLFSINHISWAQEKILHLSEFEKEWNYAQAYRSGNTLYISGTVGKGNMDKALEHVYKVLELTLKKYNLDFTHVVKENLYTTNMKAVTENYMIRKKYYNTHTPAATWVEIKGLLNPDSVVEVELIAEIEKTL